jgi:DNA-binding CsgD family transcriptional regulator
MGIRVRAGSSLPAAEGWESLTPAQVDVVWSVAQGKTNKQVADALGLSPQTTSRRLRAAYRKLGVSSRVELTRVVLAAS